MLVNAKRLDALVEEYEKWCDELGLPHVSSDEQDIDALNPVQSAWLLEWSTRWDQAWADELEGPR